MSNVRHFRVFLSAVSSEFTCVRSQVASDLRARGIEVKVQEDFRQEPGSDTLLHTLHDYIRDCDAVICIVGTRSGSLPPKPATLHYPSIQVLPPELPRASYTQWEFFFARKFQKRLSLYLAAADYPPDQPQPPAADSAELQREFVAYLKGEGLNYTPFSSTDEMCRRVLREDWPLAPEAEPIVPKGLRSFDGNDAGFFLQLLPGPFDRAGLPESIRFWKHRIETEEAPFTVGAIYGPSGCGKSSLIKAGLIPHLRDSIDVIYIEATADDTEVRILKAMRARCRHLPGDLDLKASIGFLCSRQEVDLRRKLFVVVDQFEQWLHAKRAERETELVQALRVCDGVHVQILVTIRDDFWLPISRFMGELGIDLMPSHNLALIDLFDLIHARRVLKAFGRAYGRLSEPPTGEQESFLDLAVRGLSQDGRVISVRLSLFAEMVSTKDWTPASLKKVGGTDGLGVTFLEETFCSATANKKYRAHQNAAMAVLRALLPEQRASIKGQMRGVEELRERSGYRDQPQEFGELMRILDGELRLITPAEDEQSALKTSDSDSTTLSAPRYYQLTHDYLVSALTEWLTRKQRETRRGRAELLLIERAATWNGRKQNRLLPSAEECLRIRLFTHPRHWTIGQTTMMQRAQRMHLVRGTVFSVLMLILGFGYLMLADAEYQVPAGDKLRRVLDHRALSLFRRLPAESKLRAQAADMRSTMGKVLWSAASERPGWWDSTLKANSGQAFYYDAWTQGQTAATLLAVPETDVAKRTALAGSLVELFDGWENHLQGFEDGYGFQLFRITTIEKAYPSGIGTAWALPALAQVLVPTNELNPELRKKLESCLTRLEETLDNYAVVEAGTGQSVGAWKLFVGQVDPSQASIYVTATVFLGLLELHKAGLPWRGDSARLRELLRVTEAWIVAQFEVRGWRCTGPSGALEFNDGLTLWLFTLLLRAEEEDGLILPERILSQIPTHLAECKSRSADFPASVSAVNHSFDYGGKRYGEEVRVIRLLWYPWAVETATRWLARCRRRDVSTDDAILAQRVLGYLLLTLGPQIQRDVTSGTGQTFVLTETLLGLSAVPLPDAITPRKRTF